MILNHLPYEGVNIMDNNTVKYNPQIDRTAQIKDILSTVHAALVEKGYDPTSQIVGFLLSGDPTYITSHNNARALLNRVERDEVIEVLVKEFLSGIDK